MINVENVKLPFDEDGETAIIALSKYSYDALIRKSAQLEAIKKYGSAKRSTGWGCCPGCMWGCERGGKINGKLIRN